MQTQDSTQVTPIPFQPLFISIEVWCTISGISRRQTYERIAQGKLRAVKEGKHTLIDWKFAERYLAERPEVVIKPMFRPGTVKPAVELTEEDFGLRLKSTQP